MNAPLPERMLEKFNKQMEVYLKHEQNLKKQRRTNEHKLELVFERNNQIEDKQRSQQDSILTQRYQQEQVKIQKEKLHQFHEIARQRKDKLQALREIMTEEQKQHERDIQQKLYDIQQKIKYEEFRKKTDELINKLDANLVKQNQAYLEKAQKKERYIDEFQSQKQLNLNNSLVSNQQHFQKVLANYQAQMKRLQEICQEKVKSYQGKIAAIEKRSDQQVEVSMQKALQNREHLMQIQKAHKKNQASRIQELLRKVDFFEQKVSQIEEKRLRNFQVQRQHDLVQEERRLEARAKSENLYRNRSQNMMNKQMEKEKSFQMMQQQNQSEISLKLQRLNEKWQLQQMQAEKAEKLKQSYLAQLEQKIKQRDLRLQDQIDEKLQVQRQRMKLIEDMERQKRNLLHKLEQDKVPQTNTSELRYLYTPKQQVQPQQYSKLFIT